MPFKKIVNFEISGKGLFVQGVKYKFIVQHPEHFWPFLRAPAEELMPHSHLSLKKWLYNTESELYFYISE